jgi:hypothetical protein
VSDTFVLVLTALLALGVLGWTMWGIWQIARHTPTRQRALSHVLGSTAGTSLLGVALPAVLMGALDPFPSGSTMRLSQLWPRPYSRSAGTHSNREKGGR